MRWVTVQTERGPRACGVWQGEYVDLNAADPGLPANVRELLALGPEAQRRAWEVMPRGFVRHDPDSVTLLAPIPDPRKIICLGLNYRDHAAESGMQVPDEPILFSKYATALIGHRAEILLPEESTQVDYEAELVFVIGRRGRHIPREHAMAYVAGYTIGNDISAPTGSSRSLASSGWRVRPSTRSPQLARNWSWPIRSPTPTLWASGFA